MRDMAKIDKNIHIPCFQKDKKRFIILTYEIAIDICA